MVKGRAVKKAPAAKALKEVIEKKEEPKIEIAKDDVVEVIDDEGGEPEVEEADQELEAEGGGDEVEQVLPEPEADENVEDNGDAEENEDAEDNEDAEANGEEVGDEGEGEGESKDDKESTKPFDLDEALKTTIKFKDDEEGLVFSRGPKYSEDLWPVNCHVCRLGSLLTSDQIKTHIKGRRHYTNCRRKWSDAEHYNVPFLQVADPEKGMDKPIKIYPGETIGELTPELEEERAVKKDDFEVKKPTEELIKELSKEPMHDYNKKLPLIGLCYMYKMKGRKGITYYCTLCHFKDMGEGFKHVVSLNHQYKYIERHFPKFYEKVAERLKKERSVDLKRSVSNIFRKLYRKIENAKGFRKITYVDDEDFYKNRKRYLLKTRFDDHYDENTILITPQEVDILIRKCINRMDFIKPDLKTLQKPKPVARPSRPLKRPPPPTPYERDLDDDRLWERYHYILQREVDDLNQDYQEFDRSPRKHPSYFAEERTFYKGAGKEQQQKLRREWMPFWRRRLRQLYESDLAKRKLRVKKELRLRTDCRTPSPMQSSRRRVPSRRTPSPRGYDRRYAEHPGPRDNIVMDTLPQASADPLGVISVLRLLTALEDQLGSLGPKAVQFMSKAVLAEKSNLNPNDLMMENEIYVFFVTAKEKLKGQLLANIVEQGMVGAVNRAVADVTTLLDMFEDYMRRTGKRPVSSTAVISQFDNSLSSGQLTSNQYISSSQSNQYRSGGGQYTSDSNGSANQFNSGSGQYSSLPSNQYQTGSGSGNVYSTGSGGGMNQYSTDTGSSGVNNYSSGGGGGVWHSGGSSGFQSRNTGGLTSRMY